MRSPTGLLPLLLLAACGGGEEVPTGPFPVPEPDDTGEDEARVEPVAVGFAFDGVVQADGQIRGYAVQGLASPPVVILTLASEAYFGTTDPAVREAESCIAWGEYAPEPRDEPLPTRDGTMLWRSYEGTLALQGHTCRGVLTEAWGEDADRVAEIFDGMRLGIGFGPMTDFLRAGWPASELEKYGDHLFAEYIAINGADGSFVAEDWTSAVLFEWDAETGEPVLAASGDAYVPIPTHHLPGGAAMPEGYVRSFAYWYQDFPVMDLDGLKDGAPE